MTPEQSTNAPDHGKRPVRRASLPVSLALGMLAMACTLGLWWAGYATGWTTYPPFDLADLIIRTAPGEVAVWAIANLQFAARNLALLGGLITFLLLGALVMLTIRNNPGARTAAPYGAALGIPCVMLAVGNNTASGGLAAAGLLLWFGGTLGGMMALAGHWLARLQIDLNESEDAPADWLEMNGNRTRREVLRQAVIAGLLLGGGGWLTGALMKNAGVGAADTADGVALDLRRNNLVAELEAPQPLPTPVPAAELPDDFVAPVGVRPRNTPTEEFYVIDITTRKPAIPDDNWTLRVHGLVDQPIELTYLDLLNMPSTEMDGTLMCISYTYGNDLISSTRWTGVPLRDVMQIAGIQDTAVDLILRGAGGYSDSIPVAKALEAQTLLAYGMNGETLPRDHGFPCRLYVPDIYGEKNVKWLQEIEVVDFDYKGYWQERGWSDEAVINLFAVIDTPASETAPDDAGVVPVGGVAFAGSRGIRSVRIRIDNGPWVETDLEPYDPELLWQRWRYDWQPDAAGTFELTVQAVDGTGNEQETARRDPFPDGMTGLHSQRVRVT